MRVGIGSATGNGRARDGKSLGNPECHTWTWEGAGKSSAFEAIATDGSYTFTGRVTDWGWVGPTEGHLVVRAALLSGTGLVPCNALRFSS